MKPIDMENIRSRGWRITNELEEHHMIPLSMGGTNDELNLIFLCKDCHKAVTSYQWSIWSARGDVIAD